MYIGVILLKVPAKFSLEHGHLRCSSRCSRKKKKNRGLAVLLGVSREPRPRPICGWVADLFGAKTSGAGRGDFVTLIRVSCQKEVQFN